MRHLLCLLMVWIRSCPGNGLKQDECREEDGMYLHNGICCLKCPPGTFVERGCSTELGRSVCQPCDFDWYTEHDNGLDNCLACSKCRQDQELVEQCTRTRNSICQCKTGFFCLPDQACEICKMCKECNEEEEMVQHCTAQSNTVCQKKGFISTRAWTGNAVAVAISIPIVLLIILISVCFLGWTYSSRCKNAVASVWQIRKWTWRPQNEIDLVEPRQNSMNGAMEEGVLIQNFSDLNQPVGNEDTMEDEDDKGLGSSLPNTTTSSQTSLSVCVLTNNCYISLPPLQQHNALEEKLHRLVPLNGDDSLRKSFDLFGEIDVNFHNRFFRLLGLSDNTIKSTELSLAEDRVYELLKIWMEKEGMQASFTSLIKALLNLNQRLSAENIVARAISRGYFRYEED